MDSGSPSRRNKPWVYPFYAYRLNLSQAVYPFYAYRLILLLMIQIMIVLPVAGDNRLPQASLTGQSTNTVMLEPTKQPGRVARWAACLRVVHPERLQRGEVIENDNPFCKWLRKLGI
jgi:hypothetical protein